MKRLLLVAPRSPRSCGRRPAGHTRSGTTVNRYAEIVLSGDRVYVIYSLDLAEIPAFQEGDAVRSPGFATSRRRPRPRDDVGAGVRLTLVEHEVTLAEGLCGLETARFDAVFAAEGSTGFARLRRRELAGWFGWREIAFVVTAEDGARIVSSTAPAESASDGLRAYPSDLPACSTFARPGSSTRLGWRRGRRPRSGAGPSKARAEGRFESLVSQEDLGVGVVLISLLVAMFWGAAHALTPGHGKAIVAGYLVSPVHAAPRGLLRADRHRDAYRRRSLSASSRRCSPGLHRPGAASTPGYRRLRHRRRRRTRLAGGPVPSRPGTRARHAHHHHDHDHGYGRGGLLGVGVAAGLLPCPRRWSALGGDCAPPGGARPCADPRLQRRARGHRHRRRPRRRAGPPGVLARLSLNVGRSSACFPPSALS